MYGIVCYSNDRLLMYWSDSIFRNSVDSSTFSRLICCIILDSDTALYTLLMKQFKTGKCGASALRDIVKNEL